MGIRKDQMGPSWQEQADEATAAITATLDGEIAEHRERLGRPGMTAAQFAELLPPHLRGRYWATKLDDYFDAQQ